MTDLQDRLSAALAGRYLVERELGHGGMATVYLAHDLKHDRPVALKVLHSELGTMLGAERFQREIKTAARLHHPHILQLHDSGEAGGLLYYTMPFVDGESLRQRMARERRLSLPAALSITREVASALDYAHRQGVVHRDIKPENILLTDGGALVADFGIARALGAVGGEHLTQTGLLVGTPAYMSPEQAAGGEVDGRSDQYSLGCVVYEMVTGEALFTGSTPHAVIAQRFREPSPPLGKLSPELPGAARQVLARALASQPVVRFPSVADFAQELADSSTAGSGETGFTSAVGQWSRWRRGRLTAFAVGVLALLGVATAALLFRSRPTPRALNPDLLAVAPFDVLDPTLQLWREGLVDLLARNLDGAGPLRTVPPTAVVRRWEGRADQLSAAELGRRTGARLTLFGNLVPAGSDSVRLRATLLDVESQRTLAEFELREMGTRVDRLGDSLAVRVLAELGRARRIELTRVASLGSTSPSALKAFLQGEQWFRRAAWDSALANYERALALDSGFVLVLWRLGRVLGWQRIGFDSLSAALSLRAGALNRHLALRDSLLVAVDSMLMGEVGATWPGYRRLLETAKEATRRYPDDADAWHTLGEVYVHSDRPVSPRETLAAFDRAIALDSAYAPAYIHAIEWASGLYGLDGSRRYAAEYLRRAEDVTAEGIRLAFDMADLSRVNTPEMQQRIRHASANVLLKAWLPVAAAVDSGETALRVARAFASTPDSSAVWLPMVFRRGAYLITSTYRGHLREAAREWRPDLFSAPRLLSDLALMGAYPADSAQAHFGRWLHSGNLQEATYGLPWWAARGDSQAIQRFHQVADSVLKSTAGPTLKERAAFGVAAADAYLALARRDSGEAVRLFDRLPDSLCTDCASEWLVRLRLWAARGEDRRILDAPELWGFIWTATEGSHRLEVARAAERQGEHERAIEGYQFVADAWRHADRELQPYVAEAQEALKRLTAEQRR